MAEAGAEGGEVVEANEVGGTLAHGVGIKRVADLPDKAVVMGGGGAAGQQAKEVAAFKGGKAGVEGVGDFGSGQDGDGERAEVVVQGFHQAERVPLAGEVGVGKLASGMHACIGATGGGDGVGARFKLGKRGLDGGLNRGLVAGLALPAVERAAVVVDFQGIARHSGCLALEPDQGNRRVRARWRGWPP